MLSSYDHAATALPHATRIARPDRAYFDVNLAVDVDATGTAVGLLERAFARIAAAAGPGATVALVDLDVPGEAGKILTPSTRMKLRVTLELDPAASPFVRAARVAAANDALRGVAAELKRQKPSIEVHRPAPVFGLAEPEAHREALVAEWHRRARAAAQDGKLTVRNVSFDRPVEQRSRGLEEVELVLALDGVADVAF